jgi:ATP-dependent RNA helicase RhlE
MRFADLQLHPTILAAVIAEGYESPTPIQEQAIPHVLAGQDLVGVAQTGTGKTAAFALPILHRLHAAKPVHPKRIRVLVLSPTRELASQIGDGFVVYGKGLGFTVSVIFGGVGEDAQKQALRRGIDVLVATPGRLLDLMGQGFVDLKGLGVFVLDEADRMLDMGFIHDVRKIMAALPSHKQTLLFSATMPADIEELARRFLVAPVRVAVTPPATTVEKIAQTVYFVDHTQKRALLKHLLASADAKRVLVFTRTKHGANRVAEGLESLGAMAIHGNKSQGARERALDGFKQGSVRVLVATDIAARGIDVEEISHVIQMDLPEVPEQYVHRIGRTARAGESGVAWAFCSEDDRPLLRDIERTIRMKIDVAEHPFPAPAPGTSRAAGHDAREGPRPGGRGGFRGGRAGGGGRGGRRR